MDDEKVERYIVEMQLINSKMYEKLLELRELSKQIDMLGPDNPNVKEFAIKEVIRLQQEVQRISNLKPELQ